MTFGNSCAFLFTGIVMLLCPRCFPEAFPVIHSPDNTSALWLQFMGLIQAGIGSVGAIAAARGALRKHEPDFSPLVIAIRRLASPRLEWRRLVAASLPHVAWVPLVTAGQGGLPFDHPLGVLLRSSAFVSQVSSGWPAPLL